MKFYTLDEIKDKNIGLVGTPARDELEAEIAAALIGESIKDARKGQHLTQAQLGARIGVQSSTISKIENGRNVTLTTLIRVVKGLGLTADFTIRGLQPVSLGVSSSKIN